MGRKVKIKLWGKPPKKSPVDAYWRNILGPSFSEKRRRYSKPFRLWG